MRQSVQETERRGMYGSEMEECIENCLDCYRTCSETAVGCLHKGGKHADAARIATLSNCARICQTSAEFMISGSELHTKVCAACAVICDVCGEDCARMAGGDRQMLNCAEVCRRCAESCRTMSSH